MPEQYSARRVSSLRTAAGKGRLLVGGQCPGAGGLSVQKKRIRAERMLMRGLQEGLAKGKRNLAVARKAAWYFSGGLFIEAVVCMVNFANADIGLFLFYFCGITVTTAFLLRAAGRKTKKRADTFVLIIFSYLFWIYRILLLLF